MAMTKASNSYKAMAPLVDVVGRRGDWEPVEFQIRNMPFSSSAGHMIETLRVGNILIFRLRNTFWYTNPGFKDPAGRFVYGPTEKCCVASYCYTTYVDVDL